VPASTEVELPCVELAPEPELPEARAVDELAAVVVDPVRDSDPATPDDAPLSLDVGRASGVAPLDEHPDDGAQSGAAAASRITRITQERNRTVRL
jgi:hypothetical protein